MESISQKQNIQLVYNKRLVSNIHEAEKATDSSFKKILWNNNNNNNERDNNRDERVTEMQQRRRHQKSGETRAHAQRAQNRAEQSRSRSPLAGCCHQTRKENPNNEGGKKTREATHSNFQVSITNI